MRRPLLITAGEPAGIGPEVTCQVAARADDVVVVADLDLIARCCREANLDTVVEALTEVEAVGRGRIGVLHQPLAKSAVPGQLDAANAPYVLDCLARAVDLCIASQASAMVTGPVHKGIINEAGIAFTGHTEFLAGRAGVDQVVMMLVAGTLRVALATTHLPLRAVPDAITPPTLTTTLRILDRSLKSQFGIAQPRIAVLGLNPHAGESGHLGREEIEVIAPVVAALRQEGLQLSDPLPADTAFVPDALAAYDAVLAMYHDQGLPVLKHAGFGEAVNITLGLPFARTSVDHGTALDVAGRGVARAGSLLAALEQARRLAAFSNASQS